MNRRHKLPFGAEVEAGGVRFRLWAPRAAGVSLRLEDGEPADLPMAKESDGVVRPDDCLRRARYTLPLCRRRRRHSDPASRHQPDGVHGAQRVV